MNLVDILYTVILYPLVQIIEIAFRLFAKLFDNAGIAILGVSLTVTLLCLPLYIVAEHWQEEERAVQKKLKSGVDRIKAAFKGDEQYMILSEYYRQNHYHPIMALRSSFGLLIQIPFFMAAYSCLSHLPALQGQSFLFIRDMGKPDAVFSLGSFAVNILPIAMTLINCAAGAIYTKGLSARDKIQVYGMAALFLVLLYNSPSGLVLYWTMNNVFSLVKNIFYKLKNPLKVLYILMCAGIAFIDVFILFVYSGGASMAKRLAVVIPLSALLLIPVILRGVSWLLHHPLSSLMEHKKTRASLFLFSAFALAFLCGLVLPSSLLASSVQEFSDVGSAGNPSSFLLHSFWQAAGFFVFWPVCIYFLFRKKVQTILASLFFTLLLGGILDAFLFGGGYGSMDVTLRFTDGFKNIPAAMQLLSLAVLLAALFAVFALLAFKKQKLLSSLALVSLLSFAVFGTVNVVSIKKEYREFSKIAGTVEQSDTLEKILHLSKTEKNVVVIMLDRASSAYFPHIMEDQPEIKDAFDGFVYYKNTISCNGHTLMGAPALYGGYEYTPANSNARPELTLKEKQNEALLVLPRILTEEAGFSATLSDSSWGNLSYVADMSFTDGYDKIEGIKLGGKYAGKFKKELIGGETAFDLAKSIERNLLWVSFFRIAPPALRPVVYYKGSWWGGEDVSDLDGALDFYSVLHYLPELVDFESETPSFLMMTNDATHSNEDVSFLNFLPVESMSAPDSPGYAMNSICYAALAKWFAVLKENGVYDNTKIILVSDHGMGYGAYSADDWESARVGEKSKDYYHPILLVKDFGESGALRTSMEFMCNADVPALALSGVVQNPVNPFTGNPVNSEAKKAGVFVTLDDIFMPHHSKSKNIFTVEPSKWWRVKENIFIDKNWTQEQPEEQD